MTKDYKHGDMTDLWRWRKWIPVHEHSTETTFKRSIILNFIFSPCHCRQSELLGGRFEAAYILAVHLQQPVVMHNMCIIIEL